MFDLKRRAYVVLHFATADDIYRYKKGSLEFCANNIIEVAAVKIKRGEIKEHFSTFIAIEGCDPHEVEFDVNNIGALGITEAHLIGAPDFKTVAERVFDFAKGCAILTCNRSQSCIDSFRERAASYGIIFNNPIFPLNHIYDAVNLQNALKKQGMKFEDATTLQIANLLADKGKTWMDIFAEYDVFTFSNEWGPKRQDSLTWALAFAQLFIRMVEWEQDDEDLDDEIPF